MRLPTWLAGVLAFDAAGIQIGDGLRASVGVVAPLVVATAVGHPAAGAQAAAGALPVGVAGLTGAFAPPTRLMLTTSAGMATATFVGSLCAGHRPAVLAVLALLGLTAGLLVTLGRAATIVGVQSGVAFVVFGRYPGGVDLSAVHGAWMLAGGLAQTLLMRSLRTHRRLQPQREAVAAAYDGLARLADGVLDGTPGAPAGEAIAVASEEVARRTRADEEGSDELRGLLDEAARIRLELQALGNTPGGDHSRAVTTAAASWLQDLAHAVRTATAPAPDDEQLVAAVDHLREHGSGAAADRFVAARAAAMLGQLRAAARLAAVLAGVRRLPLPRIGTTPPSILELRSRAVGNLQRLRLALTPRAPAFRHGVRLAVLLPVADVLAAAMPGNRGYWVPLTTLVVLKPDYAATMQRGVARVVGTGAGVVAAGLVVGGLHPGGPLLVILVGLFAWASYAMFSASYALFTFVLTGLVVMLVSTADPRPLSAVADRGIDTLVGGALALVGYAVWPTREAATLRGTTAALLDALADYAGLVLRGHAAPAAVDPPALGAAAAAARRARADAQASLDRALAEPSRLRPDTQAAIGVLAGTRRIVIALHALRTTLQDSDEEVPLPELAQMADDVVDSLHRLAREDTRMPPLRADQDRLRAAADGTSRHGRRLAVVAAQLDPLVDSVDTVAHVIASEEPAA